MTWGDGVEGGAGMRYYCCFPFACNLRFCKESRHDLPVSLEYQVVAILPPMDEMQEARLCEVIKRRKTKPVVSSTRHSPNFVTLQSTWKREAVVKQR